MEPKRIDLCHLSQSIVLTNIFHKINHTINEDKKKSEKKKGYTSGILKQYKHNRKQYNSLRKARRANLI